MRASDSKFQSFRKLHERFFLIPPAWDIFSAVMMEHAGFPAVATTSVGLGFALGCPSQFAISKDEMLTVVRMICRAVSIPVTVDMESGYSDTAAGVEDVTREIIQTGIVGFNLEDSDGVPGKGLRPAEEHADRIRAARRGAEKEGAPLLFINGRNDCFWVNDGMPDAAKTEEAVRRGNLYLKAGADCVFISSNKTLSADIIRKLASGINGPLNILYSRDLPSIDELEKLGVRRVTLGSLPSRSVAGFIAQAMQSVRDHRTTDLFDRYAIPTKDINGLLHSYWQSHTHSD